MKAIKKYVEESLSHGGAVFLGNCAGAWEMACALHLLHNAIVTASPSKKNVFYYEHISIDKQPYTYTFGNDLFDHYKAFAACQYQFKVNRASTTAFTAALHSFFRRKVLAVWENHYIEEARVDASFFKRPEELDFSLQLTP